MRRVVLCRAPTVAALVACLSCSTPTTTSSSSSPPNSAAAEPDVHSADHKSAHLNHRFDDAAAWAKRFDAPDRDAWQKPDAVIAALALPKDALVADVGAGTGYFSVRLARAVPGGRIVGFDVEPDMVRYLNERAERESLGNLSAKQIPTADAAVDDNTDAVLIVDTWHHIDHRVAWLRTLAPRLSARAKVAVVDFKLESDKGPPAAHKLTPEQVIAEFTEAGFTLAARPEILPDQYVLVFAAPNAAGH